MNKDVSLCDAKPVTSREEWFQRIDAIGEDLGYFQPVGQRHSAFFLDDSPTLLVTFETVAECRARDDQMPMGYGLAKTLGWSHLCLIADGETWYRDPAVYGYFDRLVDDAFFEDFDRVVFYGAGMAGYAAAAFSVTAPGATVLAIQPFATLDARITPWDRRHFGQRRLDFADRYGYAPEMVEGAGEVFLIYDPAQTLDSMHAALFTRPFVTKLPCPNLGGEIETALGEIGILAKLIEAAGQGRLTASVFWQLFRARRDHLPYLRRLLDRLDAAERPHLAAMLCRNVLERVGSATHFRNRQGELEAELLARRQCEPETAAPDQSPPAA